MFLQRFPIDNIRIAGTRGHMHSFATNIYLGDVASKDVLKSFHNLLQSGDRTPGKKLVEDLDILWASKNRNIDQSKSKNDFSTALFLITSIPNLYFASKTLALTVTVIC